MNIAIVEDLTAHTEAIKRYLIKFFTKNNDSFSIKAYSNAVAFLDNYSGKYDVVFMDINMPYLNGMDAAKKLRELDEKCVLIFITSLAQYAIEGYEVNAFDYILKPISYAEFSLKFMRAYKRIKEKQNNFIILSTPNGAIKIEPEELGYVEVIKHTVVYHTTRGDYSKYEPLKNVEQKLADYPFVKCNNCYLVNLAFVKGIKTDIAFIIIDGKQHNLVISRGKRKEFSQAYEKYLNGKLGEV